MAKNCRFFYNEPKFEVPLLTVALKWGTVWVCISTSIEAKHGQSWQFVFYHVNLEVLALTKHSFYASLYTSSYSTSFKSFSQW